VVDSQNSTGIDYSSVTPYPFAKAFRNDFEEIPLITQMHYEGDALVKAGEDKLIVDKVLFADSLFFEVFDFQVLSGNPKVDLGQPGKVFLTESSAAKLMQDRNITTIKLNNKVELEIAGIIADPPATSHISFSMIVSMPSLTSDFIAGLPLDHWSLSSAGFVYVVLPENVSQASIERRLNTFRDKYLTKEDAERKTFHLQPLSEIHFDQRYTANPGTADNAAATNLMIIGIVGIFILIIACINFVNLSTALAVKKSKEVGIRKTLGAKRSQLTWYFLTETFFLTLFAVIISLGACEWLLSWLNSFLDKSIQMELLSDGNLILFLTGLILFTTLLSGFYPSLFLSGLNPVAILKNKNAAQSSSGTSLRKVLVVFQFFISQALIIGTFIVADQMQYLQSKPLGFEKDAIVNVPMHNLDANIREAFRSRLESNPDIVDLSYSLGAPTSNNNFNTSYFLTENGKGDQRLNVDIKPVDRHYLATYGISLIAGRWFTESEEKLADITLPREQWKFTFIVNETAMRQLGFNSPSELIGKSITTGVFDASGEVIGVVKDFHVASLHSEIAPVVLMNLPRFYYDAGIKISVANIKQTLSFIEKAWRDVYPDYYFEYSFLDEELAGRYESDARTFTLFKIFSGLSMLIGCLGLYGLVSFMANQKLKEVGIRKVLGASVNQIVILFSKEFVKLILVAFVFAAPLTWILMKRWLTGFAYRIDIGWSVFAISICGTLLIALITVSYKALRAAASNPVETLRSE
jgi:putative ABC transport system permease protein